MNIEINPECKCGATLRQHPVPANLYTGAKACETFKPRDTFRVVARDSEACWAFTRVSPHEVGTLVAIMARQEAGNLCNPWGVSR